MIASRGIVAPTAGPILSPLIQLHAAQPSLLSLEAADPAVDGAPPHAARAAAAAEEEEEEVELSAALAAGQGVGWACGGGVEAAEAAAAGLRALLAHDVRALEASCQGTALVRARVRVRVRVRVRRRARPRGELPRLAPPSPQPYPRPSPSPKH